MRLVGVVRQEGGEWLGLSSILPDRESLDQTAGSLKTRGEAVEAAASRALNMETDMIEDMRI